jgi:hypothetical protein
MDSPDDKKIALAGLARCYQETKDFKLGIKCYKKLLSLAWDTGDTDCEIDAYEGLGK